MARLITRWCPALTAVAALLVAPPMVSGQSTADQWRGLAASGLQTVYVLDETGAETKGKLLGLNPDSLRLLVDGVERRFEIGQVARIQRRDSLRNGAIAGAVTGVVMGLIAGGISDCGGLDPGGRCAGFRATVVVMSTGVYTVFGIGIDALLPGRATLYSAPSSSLTRTSSDRLSGLRIGFSW